MRAVIGVLVVGLLCVSAQAGLLATDPLAYNDGTTTWRGTQEFQIANLHVFVDYCVYPPNTFPYAGYSAPDQFVYAYQVYSVGQAPVSSMSVKMLDSNEAVNIGSFNSLPGTVPDLSTFDFPPPNRRNAKWYFALFSDGLNTGENSDGLVYSSVNVPLWNDATVQDGGAGGYMKSLPSPADYIPEPATLTLLASAGCVLLRRSRK
jgi:hypothetical protein